MTPTQIKKGHVPKILLNSLITEGTDMMVRPVHIRI